MSFLPMNLVGRCVSGFLLCMHVKADGYVEEGNG